MTNSFISSLGTQVEKLLLVHPSTLLGAFALTMLLGFYPALTGSILHAQEVVTSSVTAGVNINSADAETLALNLKGVGISKAQEIVRHRETFGPFVSADELVEVKGIGTATVDKNRALITLE